MQATASPCRMETAKKSGARMASARQSAPTENPSWSLSQARSFLLTITPSESPASPDLRLPKTSTFSPSAHFAVNIIEIFRRNSSFQPEEQKLEGGLYDESNESTVWIGPSHGGGSDASAADRSRNC